MPIELTTGVPGSGKTLYTVSNIIKPLSETTIKFNNRDIPRRLCIAGIPDLMIEHELLDYYPINVDSFTDPYGEIIRRPGQDPVTHVLQKDGKNGIYYVAAQAEEPGAKPLVPSPENWWLWVLPGDVVVIDEVQTVWPKMVSGKRVPSMIRYLETHRHYGIDFVIITQGPALIHANVRSLVGQHRHVRRLKGRNAALIYEWDHCSANTDKIGTATSKVFLYPKKSFALYKSSQLHTKQKFAHSLPMLVGILALCATPALWYYAIHKGGSSAALTATAQPAAASGVSLGQAPAPVAQAAPVAQVPAVSQWPEYTQSKPAREPDPYDGRAFYLEGEWSSGSQAFAVFGLVLEGQRVATVSLAQLLRAGYTWTSYGPCSGVLRHADTVRRVTCAPLPTTATDRATTAQAAASAAL